MTCPSCGGELIHGGERCPVCESAPLPRVEGALAADPRLVTPPARGRVGLDVAREAPAPRRRDTRDRAWREEVQDRVRSRRQKRAEAGLPLFDIPAEPAPVVAPTTTQPLVPQAPTAAGPGPESGHVALGASPGLSEAELADLPLRVTSYLPPEVEERAAGELEPVVVDGDGLDGLGPRQRLFEPAPDVELEAPPREQQPLERPARPGERAQAAALDAALLALVGVTVVYFTGRAARVELGALAAVWPWLGGYLGLLAVFYAAYFTGTTGQTPGKLITGLRVVNTAGHPPGYWRASVRALVGCAGVLVAGLGLLTMAFDPAARALHDRLFRTRVVRN
jgi:uncharacterized RDD family membrane protein YckC